MSGILPVVKAVVKSKAFTHAVTALLGFLAAWASGCSPIQPAKSAALATFECRVAVLAPYVGDAAGAIVPQLSGGTVNPIELLLSLGLKPQEIIDLAKAYQACAPVVEAPAPAPEAPAPPLTRT